MSDERVSVVMITRNHRNQIRIALEHLLELPERPRLIVVDNGSSDGTADAARSLGPHHHPSKVRDADKRRRHEVRKFLWSACLRRPFSSAWATTWRIVRSMLGDPARRAGVRDAVTGLSWVLKARKSVPAGIDPQLR